MRLPGIKFKRDKGGGSLSFLPLWLKLYDVERL
jgi:hypothetical protein